MNLWYSLKSLLMTLTQDSLFQSQSVGMRTVGGTTDTDNSNKAVRHKLRAIEGPTDQRSNGNSGLDRCVHMTENSY